MESAHRTSLAKGEVGIRDKKQGLTLAKFCDERFGLAKFDDFIEVFNQERPHEALDMKCPAEVYQPSTRVCKG